LVLLDDLRDVNRNKTKKAASKNILNEAGGSPENVLRNLYGIEPLTEPLKENLSG